MATKKTIAEQVADRFDNDGQRFLTRGERSLDSVARELGASLEVREADFRHDRAVRYAFPDGSVIVALPGAWDLGFPGCWCWRGAGHSDACRSGEEE